MACVQHARPGPASVGKRHRCCAIRMLCRTHSDSHLTVATPSPSLASSAPTTPPRPAASRRYLFPLCLHTRRSQLPSPPPAPAVGRCLLSSKTHAGRNSAEPSVRRGREWSDRFRHKSSTVVLDYSFGPRPSGLSADQTLSFVWLGESRTDIRSSPPTPHNELPISRVTT
jgi:hypothetical protein